MAVDPPCDSNVSRSGSCLTFVPGKHSERAGVEVSSEEGRRPAILGHAKTVQIGRSKTLCCYLAAINARYWQANHNRACSLTLRGEYIRSDIEEVGPHGEI